MPGAVEDAERRPCEFARFFDDTTPAQLIQRGIYAEIAIALKGGAWRKVRDRTTRREMRIDENR